MEEGKEGARKCRKKKKKKKEKMKINKQTNERAHKLITFLEGRFMQNVKLDSSDYRARN